MSTQQVTALKAALRRLNLKPDDVYGQVVDEQGKVTGTSYDVCITLDLSYKDFERLVATVLKEVWQTTPKEGYLYEKDS